MGYYTAYSLYAFTIDTNDSESEYNSTPLSLLTETELDAEIAKMDVFEYHRDGDAAWYCSEAKWYEWEKDMLLLSKRFPEVLFCLRGEGEDHEDLWEAFFLNGAVQHCPAYITYDEFDRTKLTMVDVDPDRTYSYQC